MLNSSLLNSAGSLAKEAVTPDLVKAVTQFGQSSLGQGQSTYMHVYIYIAVFVLSQSGGITKLTMIVQL